MADKKRTRYFSWCEPHELYGDVIITTTEENLIKAARPYNDAMANQRGIPRLTDEEVLQEASVIHWAWETTKTFDKS